MRQNKNIGYEIVVEIPNHNGTVGAHGVFCVDNKRKIRGYYEDGSRHYMSDYELWDPTGGLGEMRGEFKEGGKVSAIDNSGKIFNQYGYKVQDLKVVGAREVDISKMTSDPYIAGLDRPIWKPGALN